jgi:hypothetical protein
MQHDQYGVFDYGRRYRDLAEYFRHQRQAAKAAADLFVRASHTGDVVAFRAAAERFYEVPNAAH